MDMDLMWEQVKAFYERNYKDEHKLPIRFKKRPSDQQIQELFFQMKRLGSFLGRFYEEDVGLLHNLEKLKGLAPKEDPLQKRGPFD